MGGLLDAVTYNINIPLGQVSSMFSATYHVPAELESTQDSGSAAVIGRSPIMLDKKKIYM